MSFWLRKLLFASTSLMFVGCTTIHSNSVTSLINLEKEKIDSSVKIVDTLPAATDTAINTFKSANTSLDKSLRQLRQAEQIHSLIFSAARAVTTRTGVEAHAATYLIGEIYLSDAAGLEQAVLNQFEKDYATLKDLAKQMASSWKQIQDLQSKLQAFSQESFFATVPAELIKTSVELVPGATDRIDQALKTSKQVNDALAMALKAPILQTPEVRVGKSYLNDYIDLLERIRK